MNQQQFRNIAYLADRGGTGFWRHTQQMMAVNSVAQQAGIQFDCTQTPVLDQSFYRGMTSVTCQRWITPQQREFFCQFLKPIMDQWCGWLMYAIDDNMSDKCIPLYNKGREAFEGEQTQSDIKQMLNTADFVVVTTDYIKQFYHDYYGVPLENIIAVPNLLPKWWFGDRYNPDTKLEQFRRFKAKPRIGIVSSLSHYNVVGVRQDASGKAVRQRKNRDGTTTWMREDGVEVAESGTQYITDDIDEIIGCIRSTVDDFQWVFFGFCPPKLQDLVDKKKIEVHNGIAILNYPSVFHNLQLQAVVAPIKDMEFNRCKSHIKYMEAAALGVPLLASDQLPYNRVMPREQLFSSGDQLETMLKSIKFMSAGAYRRIIENQWKWLNSEHDEGDFHIHGYWLEDNLKIWTDLLSLRPKTMRISMQKFAEKLDKRETQEKDRTVADFGGGVKIMK